MTTSKLQGVIAAVATAVDEAGEPDCARSTAFARFLLANGCDALNVLGTTGEATSFSLEQRQRVMTAYRDAGLTLDRLMVGTGAPRSPAVTPTRHAELGFGGAAAAAVLLQGRARRRARRLCRDDRADDRRTANPDLSLSLPIAVRPALARRAHPPSARRVRRASSA